MDYPMVKKATVVRKRKTRDTATKALRKYEKGLQPWGHHMRFTDNEHSTVKIITVGVGHSISLQHHHHRDEYWYVIKGSGVIHIDGIDYQAHEGDDFFCPRGSIHRVSGGPESTILLEIAFGDFSEADITRLEDRYGRK